MQRVEGDAVLTEPASSAGRRLGVYTWLAAGAVTFGLGVALVDGAAVAAADTGSPANSSSSSAAPSQKHTASSARKVAAKPSPRVTATRATSTAKPSAATSKATARQSPLQSLLRQIQYIFFNKAPTVKVNPLVQNPDGTTTGTLTGQSNNGFALTYSLGREAEYGSVVVDPATGAYTYTPNGTAPTSAVMDGFSIIANNGTAARLPGLLGAAQSLLHALAVGLGVSAKNTDEADIAVSLTNQNIIGNPSGKVNFWLAGNHNTAVLAAVGMVLGQLTGTMPTMAELTTQAMNTPSVTKTKKDPQTGQSTTEPAPMYTGGKDTVGLLDGNQLLALRGAIVTGSFYANKGGLQAARDNMANAFRDGKSVIVFQKGKVPWAGYTGVWDSTHAVTVLGMDLAKQEVYLNDGAMPDGGQNRTLSYDDFVAGWGNIYETIVVSVPPTDTASA